MPIRVFAYSGEYWNVNSNVQKGEYRYEIYDILVNLPKIARKVIDENKEKARGDVGNLYGIYTREQDAMIEDQNRRVTNKELRRLESHLLGENKENSMTVLSKKAGFDEVEKH